MKLTQLLNRKSPQETIENAPQREIQCVWRFAGYSSAPKTAFKKSSRHQTLNIYQQ